VERRGVLRFPAEREQVDLLVDLRFFHRVEAADEQDLVDQRVELGRSPKSASCCS
jgi:hypothetical protein